MTFRYTPAVVVFFAAIAAWPCAARAQSPKMSVGVDASARAGRWGTPAAFGPHVTFHVAPQTDVEIVADLKTNRKVFVGRRWTDAQYYFVQARRAVAHKGGFTASLLAGAGVLRDQEHRDSYTTTYAGPATVPERMTEHTHPVFLLGTGFQQILGPRAAVRTDINLVFTAHGFRPRALVGVSVPLGGKYQKPIERAPFPDMQPLRTGQRVWIETDDGTEVSGTVRSINFQDVELRAGSSATVVHVARIRRIDIPDSLTNGTKIGAAVGASAMGGFALLAAAGCSGDCDMFVPFLIVATSMGTGLGALIGAWSDIAHEGRQTVFERREPRVRVEPIAGPRLAGMGASIRW